MGHKAKPRQKDMKVCWELGGEVKEEGGGGKRMIQKVLYACVKLAMDRFT